MKTLLVLSAALAVASASTVPVDATDVTAYDYHRQFGIPNAERIRKFEESVREEDPSRISGPSSPSLPGQQPYHAGLLVTLPQGISVCGAAVLSNTRLVTAAHCWFDGYTQATLITAVLGSVQLFYGGTRTDTRDVYMHRQWTPNSLRNDVAVIAINRVSYSETIQFIPLPLWNEVSISFASQWTTVSGFGVTEPGGAINGSLRHMSKQVITTAVCQVSYGNAVTDNSICTSGVANRGICGGDSGGPLVTTSNSRSVLIGIASFGPNNCTGGSPSVFTRIGPYTPWILDFL